MPHCTQCGAELRGSEKFCGECGNAIGSAIATDPVSGHTDRKSVSTLMGMAKTAELGSNNAEALEYYNRVLEIDPTIPEAWIGKGRASAWQSTLARFRISEGVIAFQHAIANSGEHKGEVIETVVEEVNKIVTAHYRLARDHLEQYASLDNTWVSYLAQVAQMLDALEEAWKWSPNNKIVLENIVHLTKDNIEGYKFWDNIYNVSGLHAITPEYEQVLRELMNKAVTALREIDENYAPPVVDKKQADACFIVTATMGDFNHPHVSLLRRFRDEWLLTKNGGATLVSWYYWIGPHLASWVEKTNLRRRASYILVVCPAVRFARSKLKSD